MDIIVLVARLLFAVIFVAAGLMHIIQLGLLAGLAETKGGLPPALARPAVIAAGAVITVGGLMIAIGLWGDLGAVLIIAFLLPTTLVMHAFWKEDDPIARQLERVHFNKNFGLIGGGLSLFVLYGYAGEDLGLTATGPLFDFLR